MQGNSKPDVKAFTSGEFVLFVGSLSSYNLCIFDLTSAKSAAHCGFVWSMEEPHQCCVRMLWGQSSFRIY